MSSRAVFSPLENRQKLARQGTAGTTVAETVIQKPLSNNESRISVAPSVTPWQNPIPTGSVASGNRELFPSSLQRRGSTSSQDSVFDGITTTTTKEEQVRLALVNLNRVGQDQKRILNDTFYEIMAKFDELKATNEKFTQLNRSANGKLSEFEEMRGRSELEYTTQVQNLQELHEEGRKIEELQRSLQNEKGKVEAYRVRMDDVRQKIQRQQEKELIWRDRASVRMQLLWGAISLIVLTYFVIALFSIYYNHGEAALNWSDESLDAAERAKRLLRVIDKEL